MLLLQSLRLVEVMRKAGKAVELVTVRDAGHHWSELGGARPTLGFLKRTLSP